MRTVIFLLLLVMLLTSSVAHAASATYTYDALGRITQVLYDNGTKIVYVYDASGNLTSKVVTCATGGC